MTESLYHITLIYLRKNRHLVNFTKLNQPTIIDMFKIIKDKTHLSKLLICRSVTNDNWMALYSYLIKYHPNYTTNRPRKCRAGDLDITGWNTYIKDLYINPRVNSIYDLSKNTMCDIHRPKKHMKSCYIVKNQDIMQKFGIDRDYALVYDIKLFSKFPKDAIEWAIKNNHLREPILISREFLEKC